ncbi:MAG: transposase, partial [Clostridia bacterium]|nr:transposase [Clostridia bacterium]
MPSKPSGEIKTYTVEKKLSNGDVYVYERQVQYDPLTKRNQQIGSKLLGKKVQGQGEIVPTRPKRRSGSTSSVTAKRRRLGMMEILDHVGKASGIDALLYANTDRGTAQKIISLAQYLVATEGRPLPSVVTFQYTHPLPYEEGLSEDIYHDLFAQVGRDASLE